MLKHTFTLRLLCTAFAFAACVGAAGCSQAEKHEYAAPNSSSPGAPMDAAQLPSDAELDAQAQQAINATNADAEFEKLKQEIEGG
jgi:hypothetical protein